MKKIILLLFILFSCEEKIVVTEFTNYNNIYYLFIYLSVALIKLT